MRNPLRAGICQRVHEWRWSSHDTTVGVRPPDLVSVDRLLSFFAATRSAGRARYQALVEADEDPRPLAHPLVDGDEQFIAAHLARIESNAEHARKQVCLPRPPLEQILAADPDVAAIARANREHGYSMREIACQVGWSLATVSRRIRAHEAIAT